MKLDILSDTHFDSHFKHLEPNDDMVADMWRRCARKSDTLIIAGDIGHNNWQNINILKSLRRQFYKNIILVLGNHDYYIRDGVVHYMHGANGLVAASNIFQTSKERVAEFKQLCGDIDGVHLLDGDVVEIDGVKFGGAMGWYDGSYWKHNRRVIDFGRDAYKRRVNTQGLWENSLDDALYIKPKMRYDAFLQEESEKIERVLAQKPDVMVTHISPSNEVEHQNRSYIRDAATSFFCYDGKRHMNAFEGKYWVFGHSHFNGEFDIDGRFKLVTNCLGYAAESWKNGIRAIDL